MIYKTLHDIPIKIYHRIIETGDVSLLEYDSLSESIAKIINKEQFNKADSKELQDIFNSMREYQFNKFGVSDEFKEIFYIKNDIIKLQIKELDGDLSVIPKIKTFESRLKFILKKFEDAGIDIETAHARERRIIEKETGRNIDNISAFDFYTDLKDIVDNNKKQQLEEAVNRLKNAS